MSREFSLPKALPANLGTLTLKQASARMEYRKAIESLGPQDLDQMKKALISLYDQIELYKRVIANLTSMGDD